MFSIFNLRLLARFSGASVFLASDVRRFAYKKRAFSLVEMLMALLVASLLLTALAPVITKKMNETVNVSGSLGGHRPANIDCYPYAPGAESVEYKLSEVYSANFIIASGGGGGAGATAEKVLLNQSYDINSTSTESVTKTTKLNITKDMDDLKIEFMSGGGGGGGGGATIKTGSAPSPKVCALAGKKSSDTVNNTDFATYEETTDLCVTKFNQKIKAANTTDGPSCFSGYAHDNNWVSDNVTAYDKGGPAYRYAGHGRWVCNHPAAVIACQELAEKTGDPWELPGIDVIKQWKNSDVWRKIHLCDNSASSYVSRCYRSSTTLYTYGGTSFNGHPLHVWSASEGSASGQFWVYYLNGSWYGPNSYVEGYPFSVRCVLGSTETFYSLSAAGGGAAPAISSGNTINAELNTKMKENVGGVIVITAGGGGAGGAKADNKAQKASDGLDGKESCVSIYKSDKTSLAFKVCVVGGKGGAAADGTAGETGSGGEAAEKIGLNDDACYYQTEGSATKHKIACSSEGAAGTNGISSISNPSGGGEGGISSYPGSSSVGASYSGANGFTLDDGANPGAGGGGGRALNDNSIAAGFVLGDGGRGSGGKVVLKYTRKFPGAGGGGGASGSVLNINNVYVGKNAVCNFKIGKGGKGGEAGIVGSPGSNGADGEETSIVCDSQPDKIYKVPGGMGGKAGIPAQDVDENPTAGLGGIYIEPEGINEIINKGGAYSEGTSGEDAVNSVGGNGAKSGTGIEGGLGGYSSESNNTINGGGFTYSQIVTPNIEQILAGSYGSAGAGGGGGTWVRDVGAGAGGDGLGGYVCVFWSDLSAD